jgi:hypothetical protein
MDSFLGYKATFTQLHKFVALNAITGLLRMTSMYGFGSRWSVSSLKLRRHWTGWTEESPDRLPASWLVIVRHSVAVRWKQTPSAVLLQEARVLISTVYVELRLHCDASVLTVLLC